MSGSAIFTMCLSHTTAWLITPRLLIVRTPIMANSAPLFTFVVGWCLASGKTSLFLMDAAFIKAAGDLHSKKLAFVFIIKYNAKHSFKQWVKTNQRPSCLLSAAAQFCRPGYESLGNYCYAILHVKSSWAEAEVRRTYSQLYLSYVCYTFIDFITFIYKKKHFTFFA